MRHTLSKRSMDDEPTPRMTRAGDDLRCRLRRAMDQELTREQRVLLLLWYAERMNPTEIAACLNSTPGQVVSAHGRAVETLRRAC
ncbi:MAG TPA: hypothetical protein DEB06_07035 [Phycisphaerales bacterium]|nr:hypothetical protein [Phycisphaerales bacterium]